MTSAMTLRSKQWCALRWLVNLNSGLRPKLSRLVSVFNLSERLIQQVKWPNAAEGHLVFNVLQPPPRPIANPGALRDGDILLFVCSFVRLSVCLSVCRLWNLLIANRIPDVVDETVKTKCLPILYYGIETRPSTKPQYLREGFCRG